MFKNLEGARLGIFIFISTTLFVFAIFLVGNKDSLFVQTINVKTIFSDVEGLKTGAPVRLSGMDIGAVTNISLTPDTVGLVQVSMRIENTVRHLIRLDSEATIGTEGLVGKKLVMITPGSAESEIVSDGGTIRSVQPVSMNQIIQETQSALSYFNEISKNFSEIVTKINEGKGTIGKLVNDEELYFSVVDVTQSADTSLGAIVGRLNEVSDFVLSLSGNVESIITNVDTMLLDVNHLIEGVEEGKGMLGALLKDESTYDSIKTVINNLVLTTEYAVDGIQGFSENMEALKHNWLFKSYFEQRGYWDRADYERQIDEKLELLNKTNEELDRKLEELRELESKLGVDDSDGN
ncbi:MAG: hypothetical protein SCALA702_07320 [Melioribacteraceae bacterium]|nr:MAG: hypothetical protein SCALA702_07320 [Melioribacteraceae bacterium]